MFGTGPRQQNLHANSAGGQQQRSSHGILIPSTCRPINLGLFPLVLVGVTLADHMASASVVYAFCESRVPSTSWMQGGSMALKFEQHFVHAKLLGMRIPIHRSPDKSRVQKFRIRKREGESIVVGLVCLPRLSHRQVTDATEEEEEEGEIIPRSHPRETGEGLEVRIGPRTSLTWIREDELAEILMEFRGRRSQRQPVGASGSVSLVDTCKEDSMPTGLEQLGGMGTVFERLRRVLTYALRLRERSAILTTPAAVHIPLRGLVLHGPSGTGKTHILRSLREECLSLLQPPGCLVVASFDLTSRMLSHSQYGKTEAEIRAVFRKARDCRHDRALVLCDDIHAMLRNKRVVRALGVELDRLGDSGKVLFVATALDVSGIDPSLRRAGRIDEEIELPIPTEGERGEIVLHLMKQPGMPESDVVAEVFTERTHGYVGADLKALFDDFRQELSLLRSADVSSLLADAIQLKQLCLGLVAKRKPTVLRQSTRHVPVSIPKVPWTAVAGQESIKQELRECIEWQYERKEDFARFGIRPPKGVLLYGPPGCSKTLCAKALATECRLNFLSVKGPELFSKWVGESEKAVARLFVKARKVAPCILFFDEIDGLAVERGSDSGSSAVGDRVLSQLLSELDGIRQLSGVTLVAATNRPDLIDRALLRPGRIDRMIYVGPPDLPSRVKILRLYVDKMAGNHISPEDIQKCAEQTDGYSGAELCAIVREAAYLALAEDDDRRGRSVERSVSEAPHDDDSIVVVHGGHLKQARKSVPTRLSKEMMRFYEDFEKSLKARRSPP